MVWGVRRADWREVRRGGSRGAVGWRGMGMGVGAMVVWGFDRYVCFWSGCAADDLALG